MSAAPDAFLTRMFVNGQAMSGGSLNGPLAAGGRLLGPARTADTYRFWSWRDEYPALQPVASGGWHVPGELYAVPFEVLRNELLPREPAELELGVIRLEDGTGSLSMRLRDGVEPVAPDWAPIPYGLGWRAYLSPGSARTAATSP
jgi:hypothetical protein